MKRIVLFSAILFAVFCGYKHNTNITDITMANIEALSNVGENYSYDGKVSDMVQTYSVEYKDFPDSIGERGEVLTIKKKVVGVTHTVGCSTVSGKLSCTPRTDKHSSIPDWNYCPFAKDE